MRTIMRCAVSCVIALVSASMANAAVDRARDSGKSWQSRVLAVPYPAPKVSMEDRAKAPYLVLVRQDAEKLEFNRSVIRTPMKIGARAFEHGLGTHSTSEIRVVSPEPIDRFSAWVGIDNNERTGAGQGSVVFSVTAGNELFRSDVLTGGKEPVRVDVDTKGANVLVLKVGDEGDIICDHADWAEASVTLRGGQTMRLDEMELRPRNSADPSRYPFSFVYDGRPSDDLLAKWNRKATKMKLDSHRTQTTTSWTDPNTGLEVQWEVIRYSDFNALDWVLYFKNTGVKDTPIIENVQALNLLMDSPISPAEPYRLHKTAGDCTNPEAYVTSTVVLDKDHSDTMGGTLGQSSRKDFPFFKVESGDGSTIFGVGWGGQWLANLGCQDGRHLHATIGLEITHFKLHSGERVRSPRVLVLTHEGDTMESNNQIRRLIYKHYTPKRNGKDPLPTLFCNTCYTRFDGGWLNECNAENQISLIKAYAKLRLEALVTDAGWFEGGWPAGAGNWTPRKDAYPDGMGPVAAAAKANGLIYGLWFEPERVVKDTWLDKNHPEWVLTDRPRAEIEPNAWAAGILNFGLPEVPDYFFNIVKGFMDLPGFKFYRQDHNLGPLSYLRYNDAEDRQGITEMKYFEGLYVYWDKIADAYPDSFREECAGGGGRIDLETIKRFHIHQKSDYNFDYETNQQTVWALSQYMPNNSFVVPLKHTDDYAFHSNMASSLLPAWIADDPSFDFKRGKQLTDRYRSVRHLLIGDWYPLTPNGHDPTEWMAQQWNRPDLSEGMIIALRRPECPSDHVQVALHGLDPKATYELTSDRTGAKTRVSGADLAKQYTISLPEKRSSDLITYRKVQD